MRTVQIRSLGGPEVLEIAEVPVPEVGQGQVRILVEAAAVNPVDLATRAGVLATAGLMTGGDRTGIGWDVAGVVDETGTDAFAVGDRVIGLSDRLDVPVGAQAELVVLDADAVAVAPPDLDAAAAATLPLNGSTAAQALDLLDLEPGQSVLVTGAAGAVGGFAVELAAARGLRVVATAGDGDEELVRRLGADVFVPRSAPLSATVREAVPGGVAGALDAAILGVPALDAVRGGGAFVAVVSGAAPPPLRGIRVTNVWVRADGTQLAALASAGLTPRVAETLPLAEGGAGASAPGGGRPAGTAGVGAVIRRVRPTRAWRGSPPGVAETLPSTGRIAV
jgi:NADPH:quinone reductase-like Zn-dependent oxidoreductase